MVKFETETGSLYEVDEEANKVRRLIGVKDPTPRQGSDGEWKSYKDRSDIVVGRGVLFLWAQGGPCWSEHNYLCGPEDSGR